MFSIKKLLGHDQKFFDLLEASAQQADQSVHHLVALPAKLEQKDSPQRIEEFVSSRRKDQQTTQALTEQLCKTFITPLEREDIQALAASLYKIPKTVGKIGARILICPDDLHGRNFEKHLLPAPLSFRCQAPMVSPFPPRMSFPAPSWASAP